MAYCEKSKRRWGCHSTKRIRNLTFLCMCLFFLEDSFLNFVPVYTGRDCNIPTGNMMLMQIAGLIIVIFFYLSRTWANFSSLPDPSPNSILVPATSYDYYIYFNFTSFRGEFFISDAGLNYGKWFDRNPDIEIPNDRIVGRSFNQTNSTRFGAIGRDWSPTGTEGYFVISAFNKYLDRSEQVLNVYFDVPFFGNRLLIPVLKSENYLCFVSHFDCYHKDIGLQQIKCN